MTDPAAISQLFTEALAHHQAGRLAEAQPLYQQILAAQPNHAQALHMLGVLWHQAGHSAEGAQAIARSISIAATPDSLSNYGEVLRTLGKFDDAAVALRRAIELNPNLPDAHCNLGMVLLDVGRLDESEKHLNRACQLAPQRADFHARLCRVRQQQGDPYGAVAAGKRATELAPNWAEAWSSLATALAAVKKDAEAMDAAKRGIELAPSWPEPQIGLGAVHEFAGRFADAEAAFRKVIELSPNYSLGHRKLAALLDRRDDIPPAISALERAVQLQPRDVDGWNNLSALRRRVADFSGAVAAADRSLALAPNFASAHGNRGLALLGLGDYENGFAEYEWRWRCRNFTTAPREFPRAMWDGADPAGRTIFVHTEQGYGDTLQFVRYLPMLADRGARIILECAQPLVSLLIGVQGVARVVPAGMRPPDFDLHIPLLSLPRIFGTTLSTVPSQVPYIAVSAERIAAWKMKTDVAEGARKVGLVWAGNIKPDPARTCGPQNLAVLAKVRGAKFFSLQKPANSPESMTSPALEMVDLSADLRDFADTAAAMMSLDLIITIDTAAAHLAGALGRRTWTLLPHVADWRWLTGRSDSPWYPTMRLFRQPAKDDWPALIAQVVAELSAGI